VPVIKETFETGLTISLVKGFHDEKETEKQIHNKNTWGPIHKIPRDLSASSDFHN